MIGPRFVAAHGLAGSRAGRRRLWLLTGAITAGVAALVAINSFTQNLRTSVAEQAKALLGADLSITSRGAVHPAGRGAARQPDRPRLRRGAHRGPPRAQVELPGDGVRAAHHGRPAGAGARRRSGYPFYGEITTQPAGLWRALADGPTARWWIPRCWPRWAREVGDTLALGDARFPIIGTVLNVPGDVGMATAFGPRVYISAPHAGRAPGCSRFGSRARLRGVPPAPARSRGGAAPAQVPLPLRAERAGDPDAWRTTGEDLTDALSRLGNYLGLVALIALLLGGLGVASAVHVFIKRKMDTIAVLRCLGATSHEVFAMYLLQALVMGGIGSAIGAVAGRRPAAGAAAAVPGSPAGRCPGRAEPRIHSARD